MKTKTKLPKLPVLRKVDHFWKSARVMIFVQGGADAKTQWRYGFIHQVGIAALQVDVSNTHYVVGYHRPEVMLFSEYEILRNSKKLRLKWFKDAKVGCLGQDFDVKTLARFLD